MHPAWFLAPLLLLVPAWIALLQGGLWLAFLPAFTFGLLPVLDQLDPGSTANADGDEEVKRLASRWFDAVLFATVPGQIGLVVLLLAQTARGALQGPELLGAVATAGIACGAF